MPEKLSQGPKVGYDARVGAGLSRGPNLRKKTPAAPWSQTWPAPGATLDLDFANNRGFVRGVGQGGAMDAVTFTRASNATFVKPDGTLSTHANQGALGKNLMTEAQEFDSAAWQKRDVTIAPNAEVAPDGTLTADRIIMNGTNILRVVLKNITLTGPLVVSVFVKKGSQGNVISLWNDAGTYPGRYNFNLDNPSGDYTDAGNGWYRIWFTASSITNISLGATVGGGNVNGDNFYIWGAQLELGSTATTYYPTNINQPRFDWASTAQLPKVTSYEKTEASAGTTNLLTYSEQFDNAVWTKGANASVIANQATAPDNTLTADKITFSADVATADVARSLSAVSGISYTFSIYVWSDAGQASSVTLQITTSGGTALATLSDASIGTTPTQLILSGTTNDASIRVRIRCGTGQGAKYIYAWGAQLQVSQATNTPLTANPTSNGLLIEESRTNRILWNRDASQTPNRNLLSYSEQFDNGYWTKNATTVTANQTVAPNGETTADSLLETTANTNGDNRTARVDTTITTGTAYTYSVYVKANGRDFCYIGLHTPLYTGGSVFGIDLSTGNSFVNLMYGSGVTGISNSSTSLANGWYLLSVTASFASATTARAQINVSSTSNTALAYVGDVTKGLFIWGAQLERGSTASTYEQTVATPAIWSKLDVTAVKDQTGIDGVANSATKITADAANGSLIQTITLASGSRTGSVYLKRLTGTGTVQVSLDGSTWSTVDLSASEWRRIVLSGTVTNPTVGIKIATSGDAVAMDYAQVEDGAFATTPILTTTATVTRSADVANVPPQYVIPTIQQTVGTIVAKVPYESPVVPLSGTVSSYIFS